MSELITVLGYGPVGKATTEHLCRQGRQVRVAQRSVPASLPQGASFQACDVLDADAVRNTVAGAAQVVVAIGFAYDGKLWRRAWPQAMTNIVAACEATGARMVFLDNLYMYGRQSRPLREDMPMTSRGVKPVARAEATRIWRAASDAGRIRATALRAPDFFGPHVAMTHLGEQAFGALARGKPAAMIAPPDTLHDFAYVPDIARAIATLLDATDTDYGQVWHCPSAPTVTPRDLIAIGADALGVAPKITALPLWTLPLLGLVVPMLRETAEMRFQWDRPYRVDATKFSRRFWSDVTPFDDSVTATALSFRPA